MCSTLYIGDYIESGFWGSQVKMLTPIDHMSAPTYYVTLLTIKQLDYSK